MKQQVKKIIVCGKLDNLQLRSIATHLGYDRQDLESHEDFLLGLYFLPDGQARLTTDAELILNKSRMVFMTDNYQDITMLDALAESGDVGLLYHSLTNSMVKACFDTRYQGQTNIGIYTYIKNVLLHAQPLTTKDVDDLIDAFNERITD